MTIDKDKLRVLAEATHGWQNLSASWRQDEDEDGDNFDWEVGATDESGNRYPVLTVNTAQYDQEFDAEKLAAYYAAANPITVLALLDEIERLIESRQEARELRNKMGDRLDAAEAERDALQTQVAALQAEPNSYQSGYDAGRAAEKTHADNWQAEADGLRRDASRYRFLRNQHWPVAYLAVVINPKAAVKLGHVCPSGDRLDEQVDEAMKREASHD